MKGMKFLIAMALTTFAFLIPEQSHAQRNVIKFDPLGPAAGQYFFAYERALIGPLSMQLGGGLISQSGRQVFTNGSSVTQYISDTDGVIFVPELRLYLRGCAPRGLYIQGYGRFRNTVKNIRDVSFPLETDVSNITQTTTVGGGVGLGLHVIILRILSLDVNAGPQFKDRSVSTVFSQPGVTTSDFQDKFLDFSLGDKSGLAMRAQLTVGVAF